MAHTLRMHDGFETADASRAQATTGAAGAVEVTNALYGRYAWRWNVAAAAGYKTYFSLFDTSGRYDLVTARSYSWVSSHIYITTLPGAGQTFQLASLGSAGGERSAVRLTETGAIAVFNDAAGTWTASAGVLSTGVWYVISLKYFKSTAGGCEAIARRVDTGTTVASVTHATAAGANNGRELYLGPKNTSTGNVVFDNVVIEMDDTAGNIDDPVNLLTVRYACGLLLPDGTGSYDAWTGTYADVDEVPNDGDTTRRTEGTLSDVFTQTLAATSSLVAQVATVRSVINFGYFKASAALVSVQARLRSGATNDDMASTSPALATGAYEVLQKVYLTDPATSGAWTVSALNSVESGAVRTGTAGNTAFCTLVGVEILYTVGEYSRLKRIEFVMDEADDQQRIYNPNGRAIGLCEMEPNAWQRSMSETHLRLDVVDDFQDQEDMAYLEGVRYSETAEGVKKATPQGSPEDFVRTLLNRVALEAGDI